MSERKIKLCEVRGETSIYIDAEVDDEGRVIISGQDLGKAPSDHWGKDEYEYALVVPASEKDALLLALLARHYTGDTRTVSKVRDLLQERGIRYEFGSW